MNKLHLPGRAWARSIVALAACASLAACVVAPYPSRPYRVPERPAPQPAPPAPEAPAPTQTPPGWPPMYFYPTLQQSPEKQERDRYECYRWATRETGFDPGMTPVREVPRHDRGAPVADGAAVVSGAVTGAVVGSVLAPSRRGAEGLVLGAIFGALMGADVQAQQQRAYDVAQARNEARRARVPPAYDNFRRAMTACMEGRGYNVR